MNFDQTPLCCVSPGKYLFPLRGSKHVPVIGVADTRQIMATFGVSVVGESLPIQVIYGGKTKQSLPKLNFPKSFSVSLTENHGSITSKSVGFFMDIVFPYLEHIKEEKWSQKNSIFWW